MKLSLDLSRNVFQYNFLLRFLSQDCGLLSPCNMIVPGVVLARKLHNRIFKELVATDSIVCCYVSIITRTEELSRTIFAFVVFLQRLLNFGALGET